MNYIYILYYTIYTLYIHTIYYIYTKYIYIYIYTINIYTHYIYIYTYNYMSYDQYSMSTGICLTLAVMLFLTSENLATEVRKVQAKEPRDTTLLVVTHLGSVDS